MAAAVTAVINCIQRRFQGHFFRYFGIAENQQRGTHIGLTV